MTWTYKQSAGEMISPIGVIANGYSGYDIGENNPELQDTPKIGPIPQGIYTIGPEYHDPEKGPFVMRLTPDPDNEMFGRSGFLIHGDSTKNDDSASEGCIVLGPMTRRQIAASNDKTLTVIG